MIIASVTKILKHNFLSSFWSPMFLNLVHPLFCVMRHKFQYENKACKKIMENSNMTNNLHLLLSPSTKYLTP